MTSLDRNLEDQLARTPAPPLDHQSLINQALLQHIAREDDVLADTLRRVLREEMAEYAVKPKGRRKARDAK